MADRDARIRDEAYRMWVEAGRPEGGDQHYWYEAEKRIEASDKAGEKAVRSKGFPKPAKDASPEQAPDTGPAKALGAGQKAAAKPRKGDVEGATSAPAPGPAGAKAAPAVKSIAKKDGNSDAASPAAAPMKGEAVEVAPLKTPIREPKKAAAGKSVQPSKASKPKSVG